MVPFPQCTFPIETTIFSSLVHHALYGTAAHTTQESQFEYPRVAQICSFQDCALELAMNRIFVVLQDVGVS